MNNKINLPDQVPYLPGHIFSDPYKQNFHKTQQFCCKQATQLQKTNFIQQPYDSNLIDSMKSGSTFKPYQGTRQQVHNDYIPRVQPPWLKYDRKVLRFHAYFKEHVVQNAMQNYRIRKCLIYFYLSDDTIHVTQPRVQNSGITQGIFIKRSRIPFNKDIPEPFYRWYDLNTATSVTFFQRKFRIYDCDQFTKEFFDYMGQPMNDVQSQPKDNFDNFISTKGMKVNPPDTKEYKQYFEVKQGGGHPNNGLQMHLQNDRKVLSFKAIWNDTTLEGGIMDYVINFFLSDQTVQVKEIRAQNSGKDPFPLLLRRGKLPKEPILTHYPGMNLKKIDYYKPSDFICGGYVKIYNRECLICDCDQFTRQWYKKNMGLVQQPLDKMEQTARISQHQIPPYNGYGSQQDSLGSYFYLQPKPPKKDMIKMFTCDQNILRYEGRLISSSKDDIIKKFIIIFFCGDDTVMVYQPNQRNSGIWGGKFLQRMKHKCGERYINERDFQIGSVVKLGAYEFQLIRADQFTSNYMSSNPQKYPQSDLFKVLDKIKVGSSKYTSTDSYLVQLLKVLDPHKSGYTNFDLMKKAFKSVGIDLTWQQLHRLARQSTVGPNWTICMKKLWTLFGGKA